LAKCPTLVRQRDEVRIRIAASGIKPGDIKKA
jgi:hypothetical protein